MQEVTKTFDAGCHLQSRIRLRLFRKEVMQACCLAVSTLHSSDWNCPVHGYKSWKAAQCAFSTRHTAELLVAACSTSKKARLLKRQVESSWRGWNSLFYLHLPLLVQNEHAQGQFQVEIMPLAVHLIQKKNDVTIPWCQRCQKYLRKEEWKEVGEQRRAGTVENFEEASNSKN